MHLLIRRQRALVTVQGRSDIRCRENDLKNKIEIKSRVPFWNTAFLRSKRKINQRLRKYTELLIAFMVFSRILCVSVAEKKRENGRAMDQIGTVISEKSARSSDGRRSSWQNHLGVTYQAVSKWENDLSIPDIQIMPEIAKIFRISLDELMGTDDIGQKQRGLF